MPNNIHIDKHFWLLWLAIVTVYVVIRVNLVDIPLDRDEGVFGYAGQRILEGDLPYRDVYDHKPPVVFYLYALAFLVVPPTAAGIHIFLHCYNFLTLICVYLVAKETTESQSSGLWSAFIFAVISSIPDIQGFTASTEMLMLFPISLSLLLVVISIKKSSHLFAVLSGVSGALACWTKQTAVFSVAFVFCYFVVTLFVRYFGREENQLGGHPVKSAMSWLGGAIGLSLLIVCYFINQNLLDEFIYWSFTHSMIYSSGVEFSYKLKMIGGSLLQVSLGNLMITIGLLSCLFSVFKRERPGLFYFGFLLCSVVGTLPGFAYNHYYAQIVPAAALAAGFGVNEGVRRLSSQSTQVVAICIISALVVGSPVITSADYYYRQTPAWNSHAIFGSRPFAESQLIAEYLSERTSEDETVFIFGSEPQILLLAKRKSATSFVMVYPLVQAYPRYKEFGKTAWTEIERNNPEYVIWVDIPTSILWDRKADPSFFQRTLSFISNKYVFEAMIFTGGKKGGGQIVPYKVPFRKGKHLIPNIRIYRRKNV